MKVGVAVADLFTGMAAAQAILAALIARDRDGCGQHIDMALLDCQISMLANVGASHLASGLEPLRYGNAHPTVVPYQLFDSRDGRVVVAVGNDRQFAAFCDGLLGHPEISKDARFATNGARVANREALIALLTPLIAAETTGHWLLGMRGLGIPCAEVRSVGAALSSLEVAARGMVTEVDHPTAGRIALVASPLKLAGTPVAGAVAPPLLGQHTDAVLAERLGLDAARIRQLRDGGVIG